MSTEPGITITADVQVPAGPTPWEFLAAADSIGPFRVERVNMSVDRPARGGKAAYAATLILAAAPSAPAGYMPTRWTGDGASPDEAAADLLSALSLGLSRQSAELHRQHERLDAASQACLAACRWPR